MKRYSIKQAILDAIDETDDSISRHMNTLLKWAKYCEKSIGTATGYRVKYALVSVGGGVAKLPDDCYKVLYAIPGDYTAQMNLQYNFLSAIDVTIENVSDEYDLEYVWRDLNGRSISRTLWDEQGDELSLVEMPEGQLITVVYQYNEVDEKGYWMVNESHLPAITKYLVYMIAKKYLYNKFRGAKLTHNMDIAMVKQYENDYNRYIRNARGLDNEDTPISNNGM